MEPDPEFKTINEAVKKLCFDAGNVEEDLRNGEAEAVWNRKILLKAQGEHQQFKSQRECLACYVNKDVYDFESSRKCIDIVHQRIKMVTSSLKDVQKEEKTIKNHSKSREIINHFILQRMTNWKVTMDNEHGSSAKRIIAAARQNVSLLRDKRDAFVNAPEIVNFLTKSLNHHLADKGCLQKKMEIHQEEIVLKEQQLSHISKEVLVYQQRNRDYISGLKKNIDEVSAQNAWLSMELSHIEAKVTVLKDQVEI